jgi:hypothetical protein
VIGRILKLATFYIRRAAFAVSSAAKAADGRKYRVVAAQGGRWRWARPQEFPRAALAQEFAGAALTKKGHLLDSFE